MRQRKLRGLFQLATVSSSGICARLDRTTSRVIPLRGSDVRRVNDVEGTVEKWRRAQFRSTRPRTKPALRRVMISKDESGLGRGARRVVAPCHRLAGRIQTMGAPRLEAGVAWVK